MMVASQLFVSTYVLATAFAFQPLLMDEPMSLHLRMVTKVDVSSPLGPSMPDEEEVDVVVIGAGIGGLSCASLSAMYGFETLCIEVHDTAGGVAHSFVRKTKAGTFCFDSGPSLISGLSSPNTNNPLRQVIDALDVADEISWKTYNGWMIHDYSDGKSFKLTTGDGGEWEKALEEKAGIASRQEFEAFKKNMLVSGGLSESSAYIPPFALRGDGWAVFSLLEYLLKLLSIGTKGALLTGPFSAVLDKYNVRDTFVRKWFDYLAFALSGLDAAHTQAAAIAYMMIDLHTPNRVLDYPMGGMNSLIQALVTGLEKYGGNLLLNSLVEKMILEENDFGKVVCRGVVLANGKQIRARRGVVCNAPLWNMARILSDSVDKETTSVKVAACVSEILQQASDMCMTGSFMHLHLGIPNDGLPDDLECHHSVLDFSNDVTAEQNLVIISIPTVFDPSLAPEGYHVVHAYTAACDSFDPWEKFLDGGEIGKVASSPNSGASKKYSSSPEYKELKNQKAEVLLRAIECVIPDVRERAKRDGSVAIVGTPLTHRRYNQRFRGTYGPSPGTGKDVWELAGSKTKIEGLLACGDTTFPGEFSLMSACLPSEKKSMKGLDSPLSQHLVLSLPTR